jgi:uncharacterized YigZ family protein
MTVPDEYLTITKPGQNEYREKGSRFFGFAQSVASEEEADTIREDLRKQYHDAAHHPFAYRLADGTERSSDDSEPRGTSGPSILTQIQTANLYNVQIVVVRYFGGTKLGKGGLARAFSESARLAIENASLGNKHNTGLISLSLKPDEVNIVKGLIAPFKAEVDSITYDMQVSMQLSVPISQVEACRMALGKRLGSQIFTVDG